MSTALANWRRHRLDYRWPALAALVLTALMMALGPRVWRLFDHREARQSRLDRSLAPYFAQDEGLQLIDPRLLSSAPGVATRASEPSVVLPSPSRTTPAEDRPEAGTGENDFAWDPTQGYRLSDELTKPKEAPTPSPEESIPLGFGSLLKASRLSTIALQDSASAVSALNFAKLQRQIFLKHAPLWSAQKATEHARELYMRTIMSNPLRGPQ
jgi:hypothetical protein